MKKILMLLAVLLLTLSAVIRIGYVSRVKADSSSCWPATCPYGSHSVCVEQCDPDKGPACIKQCKCHCEKDKDPQAAH
jgi:hypothetical protein